MKKRQSCRAFPQEAVLFSNDCSYQAFLERRTYQFVAIFLDKYIRQINFKLIIDGFGVWPKDEQLFFSTIGGLLCVRN